MWDTFRKLLNLVLLCSAIAWNAWVVHFATQGLAAAQHSTNCMDKPLSELAACVVYLATGVGAATSVWFYDRIGPRMTDIWDGLLWTGIALAFVPVATIFFGGASLIFPPAFFVGAIIGGALPFVLLERLI